MSVMVLQYLVIRVAGVELVITRHAIHQVLVGQRRMQLEVVGVDVISELMYAPGVIIAKYKNKEQRQRRLFNQHRRGHVKQRTKAAVCSAQAWACAMCR